METDAFCVCDFCDCDYLPKLGEFSPLLIITQMTQMSDFYVIELNILNIKSIKI